MFSGKNAWFQPGQSCWYLGMCWNVGKKFSQIKMGIHLPKLGKNPPQIVCSPNVCQSPSIPSCFSQLCLPAVLVAVGGLTNGRHSFLLFTSSLLYHTSTIPLPYHTSTIPLPMVVPYLYHTIPLSYYLPPHSTMGSAESNWCRRDETQLFCLYLNLGTLNLSKYLLDILGAMHIMQCIMQEKATSGSP